MNRPTMLMLALGVAVLPLAHDAGADGLPTSKRQHKPFVITKELDSATLLDEVLLAAIDPPADEAEAVLIIVREHDETAKPKPTPRYSNITLKRGLFESAWRYEVDGVATCKLADGMLSDAAGNVLLFQSGDSIYAPGSRKARYTRTTDGILDAAGNLLGIPYDEEPERPATELMTFAAMADGFCR